MTFKPAIWRPIALVLSAINLVGVGFAASAAEGWHAGLHVVLALGFGLWSERLRDRPRAIEGQDRLEQLELDVGDLRGELSEVYERLDFAERMLAQTETRRLDSERQVRADRDQL